MGTQDFKIYTGSSVFGVLIDGLGLGFLGFHDTYRVSGLGFYEMAKKSENRYKSTLCSRTVIYFMECEESYSNITKKKLQRFDGVLLSSVYLWECMIRNKSNMLF